MLTIAMVCRRRGRNSSASALMLGIEPGIGDQWRREGHRLNIVAFDHRREHAKGNDPDLERGHGSALEDIIDEYRTGTAHVLPRRWPVPSLAGNQ